MTKLIYLIFFSLSLGQFGRLSFLNQLVNVNLHDILIFLFILSVTLRYRMRLLQFIKKDKHTLLVITAFSFSLVIGSWNFNVFQNLIGFLYLSRLVMYLIFFLCLNFWKKQEREIDRILMSGFYFFVVMIILFGLGQYLLYPNLRNLYYLGWDPHQFRIFATFFDTTTAGVIFAMTVTYLLAKPGKHVVKAVAAVSFILMLLTYSRVTFISFIISSIHFLKTRISLKYMSLLFTIFVGLLVLLPRPFGEGVKLERLFTVYSRTEDINQGLQLFSKSPLLGVGYNRIGFFKDKNDGKFPSHATFGFSSSYIIILASAGIVGFIAFLLWLVNLFRKGSSVSKTILILILVASLFDNVILNSFVMTLFFLMYYFS